MRTRSQRRKDAREFIALQKKPCLFCDTDNMASIEFHHINPSTKKFNLGDSVARDASTDRLTAECAKCVCLCSSCHKKYHWLEGGNK